MLNQEEIKERADFKSVIILGDIRKFNPMVDIWFQNGYVLGYKQAQETIPSECIGFAEWIAANSWHHYVDNHGRWRIQGKTMEYSTEELYKIYIESLKQKL